jgi:hypothetical protein
MFIINGEVVQGLQAAGRVTLLLQFPHFERVLPDFHGYHPATLNLRLDRGLRIETADRETWYDWAGPPGELFGFLKILIEYPVGGPLRPGWIYIPHGSPHYGNPFLVEVISQKIEGIVYGSLCRIHISRGKSVSGVLVV